MVIGSFEVSVPVLRQRSSFLDWSGVEDEDLVVVSTSSRVLCKSEMYQTYYASLIQSTPFSKKKKNVTRPIGILLLHLSVWKFVITCKGIPSWLNANVEKRIYLINIMFG